MDFFPIPGPNFGAIDSTQRVKDEALSYGNISISGRTITPAGYLVIDGVLVLADSTKSFTLRGSSEGAQYDLIAYISNDTKFGLDASAPVNTTQKFIPGQRKIGVIYDYPTETRSTFIPAPFLAFQNDQYAAIEIDGFHVKAFGTSTINYGQIIVESPTLINNLNIYTDDTAAHINTPSNEPTDISIFSGRSAEITGGGNLGGGHTYIRSLQAIGGSWIDVSTGIHLKAGTVGTPTDAANGGGIDMDMSGASTWASSSGLLHILNSSSGGITIETTGVGGSSGGIIITAAAGSLALNTNTGILTIQSSAAALTIVGGATSDWSISAGNLTVENSGTGAATFQTQSGAVTMRAVGAGSLTLGVNTRAVQLVFSSITASTTRNWTFPNFSDTFVGMTQAQTISNKTLDNSNSVTVTQAGFILENDGDPTKKIQFQLSSITTGTTRVWTFPDAADTFVGTTATQTLTNKTMQAVTISAGGTGAKAITASNTSAATVAFATFTGGTSGAQTLTFDKNMHVAFSQGTLPGFTLGTGAGTGAGTSPSFAFLTGSCDQIGLIQLTTGTQVPAGSNATIVTITFATAMAVKPFFVRIEPTLAAAQNLARNQDVCAYQSSYSTTGFAISSGSAGLATSTLYQWVYLVF